MAGVINTGSHPKFLWPGIKAIWGKSYDDFQTEYTDLFESGTSDKAYEEDVQLVGFGLAPVKSQGQSTTYTSEVQGFTTRYTHVAYSLGYIVTHEELKDNKYMEVSSSRAPSLARGFRQTKERVGANIYNRATNASYTGGDGVSLLSTAHPNTSGGTWSNKLAVDADLSEASLEAMTIQIMQATDDQGMLINLMPQSLIIPTGEFYNANRILGSVYQPGTANNDINVLKSVNAFPMGIKLNHYLTDMDAWFIRTNCPNGMKYIEREKISFDQDNDFDTMNAKAKGYERYSFGWTDPRALYGSVGA
jgi:Mu-like prophage major head subunit gpT